MKVIYKFPLRLVDEQKIRVPRQVQFLDVQIQHEQMMLWAIVNTDYADDEEAVIFLRGTGHQMPKEDCTHIATVQMGSFVWHVFHGNIFEVKEAR